MKLSLKKALAALGVAACVAAPTLADTTFYANALSQGVIFFSFRIPAINCPNCFASTSCHFLLLFPLRFSICETFLQL